jgi:hypothetical protein
VANEFSWSISRHDSFQACRRRYYYAYYAAAEDPEVRRLKRLSALPLWAGSVVHETIEGFLKSRDGLPPPAEQEAMAHAVVHERMVRDWRDSEAGSARFRLFEHEYAVPVEHEDKRIAVLTVRRSLRQFFRSEVLAEALAVGRDRWLTVEDLVSFAVGDVPVALRMDFAYRDPRGRVVIVDWKTGQSEGRFNRLQLAGYALYALEQGWAGDPQEIVTELAYLAVPKHVRDTVDATVVRNAREFVARSAASMRGLLVDAAANVARLEDFALAERPQMCRRCNFRRLCFPRAETVLAAGDGLAAAEPDPTPA